MAGHAGGRHAIEGVDALLHIVDDVGEAADAQEMHRAVAVEMRHRVADDLAHLPLATAQRAADGKAEEGLSVDELRRDLAQVRVDAALDDAVERLTAVERQALPGRARRR